MATKKREPANYGVPVKGSDMGSDEYDPDSTVYIPVTKPESGANRYIAPNASKAGAGRGGQGGPTAKELVDYERKQNRGIYTADMGQPPMDPEGAKKRGGVIKKMASGGSASSRADGCATKGKTRGTMITMKGGGSAC
jgi:hypothetical protein